MSEHVNDTPDDELEDDALDPDLDGPDPDEFDTDEGFDLDRYDAEARREPYPFRWGGKWWTLPNVYDLPLEFLDLIEKEDLDVSDIRTCVVHANGPTQWKQLNELKPMPIRTTMVLFNRWMQWSGVDRGEESSSAASSKSTAGRSKRTSTATTRSGSRKRSKDRRRNGSRRGKS